MIRRVLALCLLCTLILCVSTGTSSAETNGYLHTVNGQRVLHVWGSHYDMGYAQGQILGDEIVFMMENYVLALLPNLIYTAGHFVIPLLFDMPDEYWEEAQGIIDGIRDSDVDGFLPALQRHIDVEDLLFANALGDLGAMACSTTMAWGEATTDDGRLEGETGLVRNLDWAMVGPNKFLLSESTIVIVYTPTLPNQNTVVSVTFPGYFGCLSCMNEKGITSVLNIGHNGIGFFDISFVNRFVHMELTLRQALHKGDINGDGSQDIDDLIENVINTPRSGAYVLNFAQPASLGAGLPAVVFEADNQGTLRRLPTDEPDFYDNVLIAANDLHLLRDYEDDERFDIMKSSIQDLDGKLTMDDMWDISGKVIQDRLLSTTAQTIYYIPELREMGVTFTDPDFFSPEKEPTVLTWDDLMELPEGTKIPEPEDDDDDENTGLADDCDTCDSDDEEDLCCGN